MGSKQLHPVYHLPIEARAALSASTPRDDEYQDDQPNFMKRPRPWKPAIGEGSAAANAARLDAALDRPAISIIAPSAVEIRAGKLRAAHVRSNVKYSRTVDAETAERKRRKSAKRYQARKAAGYYKTYQRPPPRQTDATIRRKRRYGRNLAKRRGRLTSHLVH